MRGQAGFFDLDERLKELSAKGDTLERLNGLVDVEMFRPDLARAVPRSHAAKGGRAPFDHVFMFKVLILQASHSLSDERTELLIKAGRVPEAWQDKPAKLAQKDRDARWTVTWSKAKPAEDGSARVDIAVPAFGDKNHLGLDRRHGLIGSWTVTDAARHDGALLPALIDKTNTASGLGRHGRPLPGP